MNEKPYELPHISDMELVALLNDGASMQLMVAASRTNAKRVVERLRANGVNLANGYRFQFHRREREEVAKQLRRWYESGATMCDLMNGTGLAYQQVRALLDEAGTTLRTLGNRVIPSE
jgi:histidinol-phosphate/aromatic aminotransferase/cobyric acid decarboxylase-like protein